METNWPELLRRVETCRATAAPALMAEIKLTDGTVIQTKGAGKQALDEIDEVPVWLNHLGGDHA